MSVESVRAFFQAHAPEFEVIESDKSSATVPLAAEAFGVKPEEIAKTLSLRVGERYVLVDPSSIFLHRADGNLKAMVDADKDALKTMDSSPAKGDLTMWAMGAEGDAFPQFTKMFEKENPGVHIKVTSLPWGSYREKFQTAFAAGTGPDISMSGNAAELARTDEVRRLYLGHDTDEPAAARPVRPRRRGR